jgi:hypothetical protein
VLGSVFAGSAAWLRGHGFAASGKVHDGNFSGFVLGQFSRNAAIVHDYDSVGKHQHFFQFA